jgi:hypothetical protein
MVYHSPDELSSPAMDEEEESEIDLYEKNQRKPEADTRPLHYWRDHQQQLPDMARLARSIYGIAGSSACVERVFSAVKHSAGSRSTLGPRKLVQAVIVKLWWRAERARRNTRARLRPRPMERHDRSFASKWEISLYYL